MKSERKINLLVILGPTASGKTKLAAHLAHKLQGEIISADSRQVFCGMDIGTGKNYEEYCIQGEKIKTHLIDIIQPGEDYHLHRFKADFYRSYNRIVKDKKWPILCGGSGLYIQAAIQGLGYSAIPVNESLRNKLAGLGREELLLQFTQLPETSFTVLADTSTAKRLIRSIEISTFLHHNPDFPISEDRLDAIVIGIDPGREERRIRIEQRLEHRLANGLIEEVEGLLKNGLTSQQLIRYGLEYKFITEYLLGVTVLSEMKIKLQVAIQQFAKRQVTFFRKMEKDGWNIHWIDGKASLDAQLTEAQKRIGS